MSMSRRRITLLLMLVAIALVPPAHAAAAEKPVDVTADLGGQAIALGSVAGFHCHDLDYPRIHCFETARARDAALELEAGAGSPGPLGATAVSYVVVFEHASYGGASLVVSGDYSSLAFIGWNDRISSFKAQNGETGSFWWDWLYGGGTPYTFCCNQNISSLGIWNDNISSILRT
jgi:hypothetical protein